MSFAKKGFASSLALGNQGEALLQSTLKLAGISTELNNTKSLKLKKEWDVRALFNGGILLEVKYDMYAAKSGNIAIEFHNSKTASPSGLTATKAHIWCHIITNPMSVWLANVKNLKEFCEQNKPFKTITAGGDNNSCMYLYKQDFILNAVFTRIDEQQPDFVRTTLENLKG